MIPTYLVVPLILILVVLWAVQVLKGLKEQRQAFDRVWKNRQTMLKRIQAHLPPILDGVRYHMPEQGPLADQIRDLSAQLMSLELTAQRLSLEGDLLQVLARLEDQLKKEQKLLSISAFANQYLRYRKMREDYLEAREKYQEAARAYNRALQEKAAAPLARLTGIKPVPLER